MNGHIHDFYVYDGEWECRGCGKPAGGDDKEDGDEA